MIPGLTVGARVWKPAVRVSLNGLPVAVNLDRNGLRVAFRCTRHNRIEPNECEVQIYGLGRASRTAITTAFEKAREVVLKAGGRGSVGDLLLEAGYDGVVQQLAKVDIIEVVHEDMRPGWVTTIRGQDGVLPFQNAFINESLAPGVDVNLVKNLLATAMQVAFLDADSEKEFAKAFSQFSATTVTGGLVLQGPAQVVLTDFLSSLKLAWTFTDGKLELLRYDGTKLDKAVLLSPATGMKKDPVFRTLGRATAYSVLNPLCTPGRQVVLVDGLGVMQGAGTFRCDQVEHVGDVERGPWDSTMDLRPSKVSA